MALVFHSFFSSSKRRMVHACIYAFMRISYQKEGKLCSQEQTNKTENSTKCMGPVDMRLNTK